MNNTLSGDVDVLVDLRYQQATTLFNQQQWYAAHDAFEELWHDSENDLRALLQAIIQISVAEYHFGNGNLRGATLLMAEGLNHLLSLEPLDVSLNIKALQETVSQRLLALQNGQSLANIPVPVLEWQAAQ